VVATILPTRGGEQHAPSTAALAAPSRTRRVEQLVIVPYPFPKNAGCAIRRSTPAAIEKPTYRRHAQQPEQQRAGDRLDEGVDPEPVVGVLARSAASG
jgi:hypothetical protein